MNSQGDSLQHDLAADDQTPAADAKQPGPARPGDGASAARLMDDEEELPLPADYVPRATVVQPASLDPLPGKAAPETSSETSPDTVSAPAAEAQSPQETPTAEKSGAESPVGESPSAQASPEPAAGGGGGGNDEPPVPAVTHAHRAGLPPPKPNPEDEPMTLLGHLGELRRRLTRVIIVIILGFIACYGISEGIYDFLSSPLKAALPEGSKLIYTSPQGAFFTYMKVALMASVFLTSPLTFYQIWSFIAPGLYKEEKGVVIPLAVLSAFFFLAGAAFCYLLVFPIAFQFFMGFATDMIVPMISVEEYLGFAIKLLIAFGVVFEMPLFAYFLARMGLLTPEFMRRQRKYAVLAIFIVAAILTPPDVFSQVLMALPMLFLYEVSIYVTIWARKKKNPAGKDENPAEDKQGEAHGDA